MNTTIEFVWKRKRKLKNGVLFTGLPGIGLVGKIAVDYMLKQFKPKKIANIYSDSFPPSVHVANGLAELIKDELYLYRFKGRDFLFLAGPVQPALDVRYASMHDHYEFASKIVDAVIAIGVKEIYTLAGINIGDARLKRKPRAIVAASDRELLKEFKKLGAKTDMKNGLISGAAGLILGIAAKRGLRGACIMGETSDKLVYGDHGAAKRVLELLIKKFGFELDMNAIAEEAKNIEETFRQIAMELASQAKQEREEDLQRPSYVR